LDSDGHFHIICHVYKYSEDRSTCIRSTVSAHLFSEDGYKWHLGDEQPYTTNIMLSNGTQLHLSTRERPKFQFDPETGVMTHLISGVCSAPACPDGPSTGCVDCKYDNWDYTLVMPLKTKVCYKAK